MNKRELKKRVMSLDIQAQEALHGLSTRQRLLVMAYIEGASLAEAGRQAMRTGRSTKL